MKGKALEISIPIPTFAFRRGKQTKLNLDLKRSHLEVEEIAGILISGFDFEAQQGNEVLRNRMVMTIINSALIVLTAADSDSNGSSAT
jgi:hypothetical protein